MTTEHLRSLAAAKTLSMTSLRRLKASSEVPILLDVARRSEPDTAGRGSPRGDLEVRGWHPSRAARVDLVEDLEEIADDAVGACVGIG